ncbi:hypothetical protein BDY19DRAFT_975671 [Irpex rosettiformis]|uniref:Uncharacterized protein n=1 Tax=Irpex rosettiformis TaxID=378272 RepID=A0ACB8TP58_9APHY|nr:hypothetical protein BDY19DRAFT_975671 [Irpex rosettiformis]
MSESSQPTYPPAVHTAHDQVHAVQPAPTQTMSVNRDAQVEEQRAERIRGGCIPCPVSLLQHYFRVIS